MHQDHPDRITVQGKLLDKPLFWRDRVSAAARYRSVHWNLCHVAQLQIMAWLDLPGIMHRNICEL